MGGGRPPVARGARGGMGLLVRVFGGLAVGGLLAHAVLRRWEGTSAAADEVTGGGRGQAPHIYNLARYGSIWLPTETAEQVCRQFGGAGWSPPTRLPRDPVVPWWRWGSSRNGRYNHQIIFITMLDWGHLVGSEGVEAFCGLVRDLGDALQVRLLPKWEGFGGKIKENLSILQEDVALMGKIVVLIDALDIFSVRLKPGAFRAAFETFGSDVVLGGERGLRDLEFDPSTNLDRLFMERGTTTWPTQANAGFMVGRSEDLKQFLAALLDWGRPPNYFLGPDHQRWDDQTALQLFLRAGAPGFRGSWTLDEKSLLVHTCAKDVKENFVLDENSKVVWYRADSESDSNQPPDRVINPFFYHAPGNSAERVCRNISAVVQSWHGSSSNPAKSSWG